MSWRALVAVALLAAVGFAVGGGLGYAQRPEVQRIDAARPIPAESPAFPSDPEVRVLPDPTEPALEPDLPMHFAKVSNGPFTMRLPVPDGWERTTVGPVEWKWYVPGQSLNTYFMRVEYVANQHLSMESAVARRIDELAGAASVREFDLESSTDDTFIATYVSDNYRRLTMERFVSLDGSDDAIATIAVVGRVTDRRGLADLLERVTDRVGP